MTVKKQKSIQRYSGLSSDTKPTGSTVEIGSTFYEYDKNDTYFTPDNTSWYVKDSKSIKKVTVETSVSAVTAYISNDVVGNSISAALATTWDFVSVAGYNGGSGKIVQAQIESNANICSLDPVFFFFTTSSPNSAKIDNAACNAPTQTDVSSGVYLGRLGFSPLAAQGVSADSNVMLYESASNMPFYYTTASGDNGIHAIMMTATAATFPSKKVTATLWVQRL